MGDADVALQPRQHELIAAGGGDGGTDIGLAHEVEDHLVMHRRAGRQQRFDLGKDTPIAAHILAGGEQRNSRASATRISQAMRATSGAR